MYRQTIRILRGLVVVLAVATMTASAATAARFGPGTGSQSDKQATVHMPRGACHQYCSSVSQYAMQARSTRPVPATTRPRIVTVVASAGFSWSDAAVGFGAACVVVLLSLGARLLRRQVGVRRHVGIRQARELA